MGATLEGALFVDESRCGVPIISTELLGQLWKVNCLCMHLDVKFLYLVAIFIWEFKMHNLLTYIEAKKGWCLLFSNQSI